MNKKVKVLSLLFALVLLVTAVPFSASADSSDTSYTKNKVVSVLFDDSGSMSWDSAGLTYTNERWNYARYALETLMTSLGRNDTLIITPMNASGRVTVNLGAENRSGEIERVMRETFLGGSPTGVTPSTSIQRAVSVLTEKGMKMTTQVGADEKSENEYILLVLTDGIFTDGFGTEMDRDDIPDLFIPDLSKYAFFQSIYVGFTSAALDLSGVPALQSYANFAPFKASSTADIGTVMQRVANRISGRYVLDQSQITINGNTVTIPLSSVPFGLRSVTLMATNTDVRYNNRTSNPPMYNGTAVSIQQYAAFTPPNGMTGAKGGFTGVFTAGGTQTFSGGTLVLTLDGALEQDAAVSVMLEPALLLSPVIQVKENGNFKEVDTTYINSHLKKNDEVYISYRILEQGTNKVVDAAQAFSGPANATVTYCGKSYQINTPIPLKEGKNEISVSVSLMGGGYNLYASFPCVVLANPTYFRIEAGTPVYEGETVSKTTFHVYDNNSPLTTLAALERYAPTVTAYAEDGTELPVSVTKNSDGTFTATLDLSGRSYGSYTLRASVKSPEGNPRTADAAVGYFPSDMTLGAVGGDTISTSLYGIQHNTQSFVFALTAQGVDIPINPTLFAYKVTVGSVDVTSACTVEGNRLVFVPSADILGDLATQTGSYPVSATVTIKATGGTAKQAATLTLTPTVFEILPFETTLTPIDRFAMKDSQGKAYFRVLRDGISLSAEELQAAIDDGSFAVDPKSYGFFLAPIRSELSVVEMGGVPTVAVHMCAGQFFLLRDLVTSMFIFGKSLDVQVSLSGTEAAASQLLPLTSASIVSYIWRILLILYLIQLIILAITFKSVKRVPKGTLVKLTIEGEGEEKVITKGEIIKHIRTKDTLLLKRLLPFAGLLFREKQVTTADNYVGVLRSNGAGVGVEITPYNTGKFTEYDSNKPITSFVRQKYKENSTDGNISRLKDKNITVAVKTEAKKQSGIIPLNEKEGYVTNPGGRRAALYIFVRPGI